MIQAMKNLNLLQKVVCHRQSKDKYKNNSSIKFETKTIKSSICDYSDAYILVTRDVTVNAVNDTDVAFKNCASFSKCKTETNDVFIDKAKNIYIAMPLYNYVVIIIQKHQEAYGSLKELKFHLMMLIYLLLILNHLNKK